MELENKKNELLNLIEKYLKFQVSVEQLYEYSWQVIDYFEKNKNILPPALDNERIFWYAIWQLQHLCDKEHEKDGTLKNALMDIVAYLKNQKNLPKYYEGKRP
jgi:hypothetical protein